MPFKSEAQRRWMYANDPEMAKRWEAHTPKDTKLPDHVKKRKKMTRKKEALELGARAALDAYKLAELDLWNPATGAVVGGMGAASNRNVAVQTPAAGQMPAKPQFDLNALRAAYQKAGVKPGLTSAVRKTAGVLEAMGAFGVKAANMLGMLGKGLQVGGEVAGEVPVVGQAAGAIASGIGGALSGAAMAPRGQMLKNIGIGAASGALEGGIGGLSGAAAGTAANLGLHKMMG